MLHVLQCGLSWHTNYEANLRTIRPRKRKRERYAVTKVTISEVELNFRSIRTVILNGKHERTTCILHLLRNLC